MRNRRRKKGEKAMKRNLRAAAAATVAMALIAGGLLWAMTGCAPKQGVAGQDASSDETAKVDFTWSADSDCAMCHSTESDSLIDASCEISASHGQLACSSCHTDTAGLEEAHEGVDPGNYKAPKRLKDSEVPKEACLSCHDPEDMIAATSDLAILTDDNGTTVNPHDLPENEEHADITCGKCHAMHEAGDPQADAPGVCASCHHAGVYECYTCH